MRKLAWLGAATIAVLAHAERRVEAAPNAPLKPFIVLDLDTSGSMGAATGSGPPSCGGPDTKLNHARCAITNIINSYGDIVFALARFRMTMGGTTTAATFPAGCTTAQANCDVTTDEFELLSPLVDGGNSAGATWTNLTGNTCTATGSDPEIWLATGNTPIEGTLRGSKLYWQGIQNATNGIGACAIGGASCTSNATCTGAGNSCVFPVIWPSTAPGFDPIRNDPTKTAFLPTGCDPSPTCTTNCCATQCRPYIVIMLTDGDETCTGTPPNAATSLLQTDVDGRRYHVQTKPIGFGITAPNANIEALAHAGGAVDLPGSNEGFYASDQAGLELAMSQIIAGSIRTESCNNLDDDCDGLVDEDFKPPQGQLGLTCSNGQQGVCLRTGTFVCRADGTGVQCDAPAVTPGVEICNNLDDDCDGKVDEGLTGCMCVPQGEICNNIDDDCDGKVDEGLTRQCGTGTCLGIETCVSGVFTGCTAQTPTTEICNGLDDDCDGVRDGFTLACSDMVTPGGPASDNPGDPSNNPIPENICHPGLKTCPANIGPPNAFGSCIGEQQPLTEICNGLDDDCDNKIDEDTGGGDCSTNCGLGTIVCKNGQLVCNSTKQLDDPTCNNIDDDCDGKFDEDWKCDNPPNCPCTAQGICGGVQKCVAGNVVCEGTPISQESCNCADDDCDTKVDEGAVCGAGSKCTSCQCALPCDNSEFPCPLGKLCHDDGAGKFCVQDPCFGMDCPPVNGNKQVCKVSFPANTLPTASCVDACSQINCGTGMVCIPSTGECQPDDCTTFPDRCTANQVCINGICVTNLCKNVTCPADQYCVGGQCYGSCADVTCPAGTRCRLGTCETDPCGKQCPYGQACHDSTGQCIPDGCGIVQCPKGQFCNPNHNAVCEDDPCVGTMCPDASQVCKGGTCYNPQDFLPDAGVEQHITTGGGGGCSTGGSASVVVGLALLALLRRKRESTRGAA